MELTTINASSLTSDNKDIRSIAMLYTAYKIGESQFISIFMSTGIKS